MAKCPGCGVQLQYEKPDEPGYAPDRSSVYCRRCFRLIHYGDLTVSMKTGINPDEVFSRIEKMDALIVWVIDLFDFEAGMISGMNRRLGGKDIIMAANKRDLLPETMSEEKIARFVFSRLREQGIQIRTLVLTAKNDPLSIEELRSTVEREAHGRPAVLIGRANSGKSTILNVLAKSDTLTISRYPGTTLDFNEIKAGPQVYIDTPGIEIEHSMLMDVLEKDLKTIVPQKTVKPVIFQLRGDQSFAIGGLARIDLSGCDHASCVFYLSDRLEIHRSKLEKADELWQKHAGTLLVPQAQTKQTAVSSVHKNQEKLDIVIDGLGWACLSGNIRKISVRVPKGVSVTYRKAML